jgi:uncharacterized membrane protein
VVEQARFFLRHHDNPPRTVGEAFEHAPIVRSLRPTGTVVFHSLARVSTQAVAIPTQRRWILGDDPRRGWLFLTLTGAAIAAYVVYFTHITSSVYRGYGYGTFDLAFYDQGVWLLSRFDAPFITSMGRNLFGDHAQFSVLMLVPLYWVRPDATTLLGVQSLVMAAGAVPVYMLAMRRLAEPAYACVFALAFLVHPALGLTNLENYHPDSFLVPVLGFAIYAAVENRPRMFVVMSVLAMLCKEDVFLVLVPLALWYAWRHNRRVGLAIAGASAAIAFVAMAVVMRGLVGVSTRNAYRIPFSDCVPRTCSVPRHLSDFATTLLTDPRRVGRYLTEGDTPNGRPFYVWQMLAPTGLMFLAAPEVAATGLLVLLTNVFSTVSYQHQIAFHYSMVLLPVLSMGTIFAVAKLPTERRRRIAVAIVGGSALFAAYMWGPLPGARDSTVRYAKTSSTEVQNIDRVVDLVPSGARVSAYDRFLPHIDHRREVYLWPTPFAASHWRLLTQEGQRLPQADDIEYLVLPTKLDQQPEVLTGLRAKFGEVARAEDADGNGAVLYRRLRDRV